MLRNFDNPNSWGDDHSLNMVRLDPNYSAQAQMRKKIVSNYSALMKEMGLDTDRDKNQNGTDPKAKTTDLK